MVVIVVDDDMVVFPPATMAGLVLGFVDAIVVVVHERW
jgi:hypothetical protein